MSEPCPDLLHEAQELERERDQARAARDSYRVHRDQMRAERDEARLVLDEVRVELDETVAREAELRDALERIAAEGATRDATTDLGHVQNIAREALATGEDE